MALSDQDKVDTLKELFDPSKVNLKCGQHLYFGPVKDKPEVTPMLGCVDCWKVWYIHEIATTPPSERAQKLEELESVLHDMTQMIERGEWDFVPFDHAQIEIGEE